MKPRHGLAVLKALKRFGIAGCEAAALSGFSSMLNLTRRSAPLASLTIFFKDRPQGVLAWSTPGRPKSTMTGVSARPTHVGGEGFKI